MADTRNYFDPFKLNANFERMYLTSMVSKAIMSPKRSVVDTQQVVAADENSKGTAPMATASEERLGTSSK
jgi:hypothetical protein